MQAAMGRTVSPPGPSEAGRMPGHRRGRGAAASLLWPSVGRLKPGGCQGTGRAAEVLRASCGPPGPLLGPSERGGCQGTRQGRGAAGALLWPPGTILGRPGRKRGIDFTKTGEYTECSQRVVKGGHASPKRNPQELQSPGGFFRLLLSLSSVQPFANVIADYTCCDRDKKSSKEFHALTSLRFGGADSISSLSYFPPKSYKSRPKWRLFSYKAAPPVSITGGPGCK